MKSLLITAAIVGVAAAAIIIYLAEDMSSESEGLDDVADAASDAYNTMNKHIGRIERKTSDALDTGLGI